MAGPEVWEQMRSAGLRRVSPQGLKKLFTEAHRVVGRRRPLVRYMCICHILPIQFG